MRLSLGATPLVCASANLGGSRVNFMLEYAQVRFLQRPLYTTPNSAQCLHVSTCLLMSTRYHLWSSAPRDILAASSKAPPKRGPMVSKPLHRDETRSLPSKRSVMDWSTAGRLNCYSTSIEWVLRMIWYCINETREQKQYIYQCILLHIISNYIMLLYVVVMYCMYCISLQRVKARALILAQFWHECIHLLRTSPARAVTMVLCAPLTAGPWSAVTIKIISMNLVQ